MVPLVLASPLDSRDPGLAKRSPGQPSAYERCTTHSYVPGRPNAFHRLAPRNGKTSVRAPTARRAIFHKGFPVRDLRVVSRRERANAFHLGVPGGIVESIFGPWDDSRGPRPASTAATTGLVREASDVPWLARLFSQGQGFCLTARRLSSTLTKHSSPGGSAQAAASFTLCKEWSLPVPDRCTSLMP